MSGLQELATSYLSEEKSLYAVVRQMLNVLCSLCLASYFYKYFIGDYYIIDITDFKKLLHFFVDGLFFIPFIFFAITHYISGAFIAAILEVLNLLRIRKLQKRIAKKGFKKEEIESIIDILKKLMSSSIYSENISSEGLIKKYIELRNENSNSLDEVKKESHEELKILKKNFEIILKFLLTISILRNSIPFFGFKFYIFCLVVLLLLLLFIYLVYFVTETVPVLFQRLDIESDKYLEHQKSKLQN